MPEGTLTIMFEDLEGSTALASSAGDLAWKDVRRVHSEVVRAAVANHGGEEIQFLGDGFVLAFDSVRRAVGSAVEIQRALSERMALGSGPAMRARIGLNVGEVLREGDSLVGAAVNAAARIASKAEGGQILVSATVKELAGIMVDVAFVDRGLFNLKGFPDRFRLYEVAWRPERPSSLPSPTRRTPFVGRRVEHELLREDLTRAEAGHCGLQLIAGEPGVGKSRLVDEIGAEASLKGFLALKGRSHEVEGAPPYIPFVEILESAIRSLPQDVLHETLADAGGEIARLVPELRRLFPELPEPIALPPEQSRRYLFNSFTDFLERASARQPLLLVVDDLHWGDESTLLLLEHIAPRLQDMPIVVLATYRDIELDVSRPLARSLEMFVRTRLAHRLPLKRLRREDVEAMLSALAGSLPPDGIVEAIFSETEGNPFFVEEVFHHLMEEGRLRDQEGRWQTDFRPGELDVPESVRLVIGHRLNRLTEAARDVLTKAAIVGRDFSVELLGSVADVDPTVVLEAADEAERARLIVPARHGVEGSFAFAHELIRQTLVAGLSTLGRQRIHARVATALEDLLGDDPEHAGDIAYHLLQAGVAADLKKAAHHLEVAGRRALEAAAFDEALRDVDAALELHPEGDRARADLLFDSGRALRSLGRWSEVMPRWHEAIGLYEGLGESAAAGAACLEAANQLSWAVRWEEAIEMAGRGLAALEETPTPDRARLLALTAVMFSAGGYYEAAEQMLEEALVVARDLGDRALVGYVNAHRTAFAFFFLRHHDGGDAGRTAIETLRASDSLWVLVQAMGFLSLVLQWGGRTVEAARIREEGEDLASRLGHHGAMFPLRATGHLADAMRGDLDAYEQAAHEEMDRSAEMGWVAFARVWLGVIAFWRGRWKEALEHFQRADVSEVAAAFAGVDSGFLFLAYAYAGRRDEALTLFEQQRTELPRPGQQATVGSWTLLLCSVEGLSMLGERDQAAELYPLVAELIETGQVIRPFDTRLVETVAGIAASSGRNWDVAEQHFRTAMQLADALPHHLDQPEVRRFYAQMLLDRGGSEDLDRARALVTEARSSYRQLGMPEHDRMSRSLLKEIRARVAAIDSSGVGLAEGEGLLRREGDLWTIAYEGRIVHLKDSTGLRYLERLLADPVREFHALDLVSQAETSPPRKREPGLTVRADLGDAGAILDDAAKQAYRRRLQELAKDLREAEEWADTERAAKSRAEIEAITGELAAAVGLGGRDRKTGSSSERARISVTKAIRGAVKKIAVHDPALGHHLDVSVRTGTFCSYVPDPSHPVVWRRRS